MFVWAKCAPKLRYLQPTLQTTQNIQNWTVSLRYWVRNRTIPTVVSGWVLARTDSEYPSPFPPPHTILRKVQISHLLTIHSPIWLAYISFNPTMTTFGLQTKHEFHWSLSSKDIDGQIMVEEVLATTSHLKKMPSNTLGCQKSINSVFFYIWQ